MRRAPRRLRRGALRAGSVAAGGEEGGQRRGKAADRHGLKHDPARPGDDGVEQPLSAEQDVFHASDGLDINGACLLYTSRCV